jgi:Annexin
MTIALYPDFVTANDLTADHYGAEMDDYCQEITDATKGWGANKEKVMDVLTKLDGTQRAKLAARYKELNEGKTLTDLCKKEFSGHFGDAMELLALAPHEAECAMLKKACKGVGSNVPVIWSILGGRTNAEMELLKKTYFRLYNKDLSKLLAKELGGDMERIAFNCLQASEEVYDAQFHTMDKAASDAETIHKKGQGKLWGTDEKGIFKILCASPAQHVQQINDVYAKKYGYTLYKAMEKELGGMLESNVRDATLHMIGMKLANPYEAMARVFKTATDGIGTNELLLTCSTIRYQPLLHHVMGAHIEMSGKTIQERIKSETTGAYKKCLVQVCNLVWPESG